MTGRLRGPGEEARKARRCCGVALPLPAAPVAVLASFWFLVRGRGRGRGVGAVLDGGPARSAATPAQRRHSRARRQASAPRCGGPRAPQPPLQNAIAAACRAC
jgi:hypothetical protein